MAYGLLPDYFSNFILYLVFEHTLPSFDYTIL